MADRANHVPASRPVETVLFDLADLAPVLVELDDEVAGYACGGVLRVLCGGFGLERGFRRDLDEELDLAAHDGYVILLAVTEDDIGVAYVQLAVEGGVRRVPESRGAAPRRTPIGSFRGRRRALRCRRTRARLPRRDPGVALSRWIAESGPRPLTPRQVLRKPDIPVAAAVMAPPENPRTAPTSGR